MKELILNLTLLISVIGLTFCESRVLAQYDYESDHYEIHHVSEIHTTGMELTRNSESIAMATYLFPLAIYNLPKAVIDGLAQSYVDRKIEREGKESVAREIEEMGALPEELHKAYSSHFEVKQEIFYTEAPVDTLAITSRLRSAVNVSVDEFADFYARRLHPHKLMIMKSLSREPDFHLPVALLKALAVHHQSKHLQKLGLVYLGHQSQHFLQSYFRLEDWEQNKVRASLEKGVEEKLIGKRYRTVAREELSKL